MADNSIRTPGSGENIASDEATYSGDTAKVQIVRLVTAITGTEGSKTIVDAAALADNTANPTVVLVGVMPHVYDGSAWDRAPGTAADGMLVNLGANNDVTNGGTFAVQVDGDALTALQLIDDSIFADDAAFTVGTSKVSVIGGVAVAHGANPDAADANDAVACITNRHRVPFNIGGHPNVVTVKHANITTAVTDTAIVTVSGGTKIVVTSLMVTLDNASTVFPTVLIGFGATTTPTTTGVIAAHGGVPAGGGFSRGDGSGIIGIGADGEDLRITTTGNATGNGLQVVVTYYTIES